MFDLKIHENEKKYQNPCPFCQTKNDIDKKYCANCGKKISRIICPICQSNNNYNAINCETCGQKFLQKRKK